MAYPLPRCSTKTKLMESDQALILVSGGFESPRLEMSVGVSTLVFKTGE